MSLIFNILSRFVIAFLPRSKRLSWLQSPSAVIFSSVQFSSVAQLCPTLCDPIDGSPPGSSVPGIFQARILEWVAISFSLYAVYIMHITGLDEAQAGIKIAKRNINNLRYEDDTTLMAEGEEL